MPLIDELPNSKATAAPGWAYVLDTGLDPSKSSLGAAGARKRGARNAAAAHAGELSTRQQNKITRHLAELDKDSHRDVQIVVPGKSRDVANRGLRGKMTPAVKKIILSQKTFANHLADEEAASANQSERPAMAVQRQVSNRPGNTATSSSKVSAAKKVAADSDAMQLDSPAVSQAATPFGIDVQATDKNLASLSQAEIDTLLNSHVPSLPSPAALEALVSAPALSYAAARAGPTTSSAPPRQFCEMCGYWGRAQCKKCGARVCGLECKNQHDDTRCLKFYA